MKRQRILVFCLAALLLASLCGSSLAFESAVYDPFLQLTGMTGAGEQTAAVSLSLEEAQRAAEQLSLTAPSAILVERATGEVLFEKNADDPRAIASITKVMTLLLTVEALEEGRIALSDEVVTSEHAYSMGGSQIWLEPGEVMTVDELMRAVCVQSANDAAVALAEAVSGSEESFVAAMNARAAELGMTNTTFRNACGLDEQGHLSTARDVALMSAELLKHELIRDYCTIWMDSLRGGETQLVNTNKLLKRYDGMTGLKTGTTGKAGICISASAMRENMELIAVVLGCPDSDSRFADARKLLDHGFAFYELAEITLPEGSPTPVAVQGGAEPFCSFDCELPAAILLPKGQKQSLRLEFTIADRVQAPVAAGQELGSIGVYAAEQRIASYPVVAVAAVPRLSFGGALRLLWQQLLRV